MGVVMCLWGVFYATIENNARRILSYHSSPSGIHGGRIGNRHLHDHRRGLRPAYAHILYKGLLFMGAGCLLYAAGTASSRNWADWPRACPW
jgi:multicomponent Na+:H+ antiporter subunit D